MTTEQVKVIFHRHTDGSNFSLLENVNSTAYHGNFVVFKIIKREKTEDIDTPQRIIAEEDLIFALQDISKIIYLK